MGKSTTIRLNDLDLERLEELKQFYADCWLCDPKDITTTEVISTAIGMLQLVKCKWELDIAKISTDYENGTLKY